MPSYILDFDEPYTSALWVHEATDDSNLPANISNDLYRILEILCRMYAMADDIEYLWGTTSNPTISTYCSGMYVALESSWDQFEGLVTEVCERFGE